jgi:phospholipase C
MGIKRPFFAPAALALLAGCAGAGFGNVRPVPAPLTPAAEAPFAGGPVGKYVKHVVIIVQENRSFENVFAGWPGADAPMYGNMEGKRIALKPVGFILRDINHHWKAAMAGWDNGKMDGFDKNTLSSGARAGTFPYSYLQRTAVAPYRTMAGSYVLADHMFPSMFGASFTAHLTLIAGTTNLSPAKALVDTPSASPWGCDAPAGTTTSILDSSRVVNGGAGPFPCFSAFRTMADTLDAAGVSWKYYAPDILKRAAWSAFDAIRSVRYGKDWANVTTPPSQVLLDAQRGSLPSLTWVTPDARDSDHPGDGSDTGPSWVAAVVNAIGSGPDWNSTAIVVVWDEWGGWYDNVPPPQLDFKGLGIRVPCLIISPYAKRGYVSHTRYEFGSILKFGEQVFKLPPLGPASEGYTDGRANSLLDAFDFTQKPRAFVKIPAKYPASHFLAQPQSMRVPDDD